MALEAPTFVTQTVEEVSMHLPNSPPSPTTQTVSKSPRTSDGTTSTIYTAIFNTTTNDTLAEVPQIPAYIRSTAMVFCITIMVLGVIGNIMVPIVIVKTKDMRNSTNIFLTNLSLADLLVLLICTPTVLVEVNTRPETWVLGHAMCKAVPFVELTVAHASVLTILAISFERYYAICEPLKAGYVCTKTRAILICLLAWGIAALFTSPILLVSEYAYVEYVDGSYVAVCLTQAITNWTTLFFLMTISVFFVLPLIILIVLYGIIAKNLISNKGPMMRIRPTKPEFSLKARKQVVYMLGAVVLSFFLCLLPFRMLTTWIILSSEQTISEFSDERYYILLYFCRIMFYLNSAINPILYNLMSTKFRKGFFKLSCSAWHVTLETLTCGRPCRGTARGKSASIVAGHATSNTTSNTATTNTSSSILSRSSNRRSSNEMDVAKTRLQIQMQMPCGSDSEMMAMLHASDECALPEHGAAEQVLYAAGYRKAQLRHGTEIDRKPKKLPPLTHQQQQLLLFARKHALNKAAHQLPTQQHQISYDEEEDGADEATT